MLSTLGLVLLAAPELLGHHVLGPTCLPLLTSPPLFRVGGDVGPFEVVLVGVDAQTHPLVEDRRVTGQVLRSRLDTVLPRGIGWVVLRGAKGEIKRWNVLWDADLSAMDAAVAAAKAAPSAPAWQAAAAAARGVPSAQADALRHAAAALAAERQYGAAFEQLAQARATDALCPTPRAEVENDHLDARLRLAVGDFVGADRRLVRAMRAADAGGFDDLHPELAFDHATALRALGRPGEAWAALDALGVYFPNAGIARATWRMHKSEAGLHLAARFAEVRRTLEAVISEAGAATPLGARALLHLAGLALTEERPLEAKRHLAILAAIPKASRTPTSLGPGDWNHWDFLPGTTLLVEGALAQGAEAQALFERALALASATGDGELAWRARHGLGRVAWRQGDLALARSHFEAALAELHRHAVRGIDTPAPAYLATHFDLVGDLLALLMAGGQTAEAMEVADDARSHRLDHLAMRARIEGQAIGRADAVGRYQIARAAAWAAAEPSTGAPERAVAKQSEPAPGPASAAERRGNLPDSLPFSAADVSALLAAVPGDPPAEAPGLSAIQAGLAAGEVVIFSLLNKDFVLRPTGSLEPLRLLEPTTHVYVVGGNTRAIFHRNPEIEGRSWSRLPYGGLLVRRPPPAAGAPVVVGDALIARRLGVAPLVDPTPAGLLAHLADARLLHFAGQGPLGGESPWKAHLALPQGRLGVAELLTTPHRVDRVVLGGGEPGVPVLLSVEDPVGLADVLLLAGARSVVAAVEAVDDDEVARFLGVFYEQGGAERPGPALQAAHRTLGRHPFQLWGRP
jgi:tetratricopeptide (TPR) repeat protein